jgi:hypothetical protein
MNSENPSLDGQEHFRATGRLLLAPPGVDLFRVRSLRWFLQAGLAGAAGLAASPWVNPQGRPIPVVPEGGKPIQELL